MRTERGLVVLEAARQQAGLSVSDLWIACVSLGSMGTITELEAILSGRTRADRHAHNLIAQALNDRFTSMDLDHPVAYFDDPPT